MFNARTHIDPLLRFSFSQAVKLESLRAGRTRYLVVVSRPVSKSSQQQIVTTDTVTSHSISNEIHQQPASNSISLNPTSYFNEATTAAATTTSSGGSRLSVNLIACDNINSIDDDDNSITTQCPYANDETESNVGSSCSRSSSNEIEESCLLGIDCNEKTTVGLVLKVLADTAIRLDGDG
jgi:hypothetical protein